MILLSPPGQTVTISASVSTTNLKALFTVGWLIRESFPSISVMYIFTPLTVGVGTISSSRQERKMKGVSNPRIVEYFIFFIIFYLHTRVMTRFRFIKINNLDSEVRW